MKRKHNTFAILLTVGITLSFCAYQWMHDLDEPLANGYALSRWRADNTTIKKGNEIVVPATVADVTVVSKFIVGLRLPVRYVECDNGNAYKIRVQNERKYFVLNSETGAIYHFEAPEKFYAMLAEIGIADAVVLDPNKFSAVWEYYNRNADGGDLEACTDVPLAHHPS